MHPKSNHKHFLLFLPAIFIIISIHFPAFFCQNDHHYATCSKPFRCGGIRNISFPFWGGGRPLSCGQSAFELKNCHGNDSVPLLNISSLSYRVLEIDFSTHTLKVARQDLWNNTCPKILQNTTTNPNFFEFSNNANDENITLYFGCTANKITTTKLFNKFSCDFDGRGKTINLYKAGNYVLSGAGYGITCSTNIFVPVNREAARSLKNPKASSIDILQAAFAAGFSIQWREDPNQHQVPPEELQVPGQPAVQSPGPAAKVNNQPRNGSGAGHSYASVGPTLGIGGVIIVCIIICCFLKNRFLQAWHNRKSNQVVENFLLKHGSLSLKRYKYSELKKITKSFSNKLGQGGYGSVYKGTLPGSCLVAVKVLTDTDSNGEEFINEVASISRTSHVNIVNLLGFCYDGNKRALVYEFMPNKSLDKFISINGADNCQLGLEKLYKIAVGVAKGLEYLHTGCNTRIVHFDIKPQNILLDENFCPKISDFGLAKLCMKKESMLSMVGARGTAGYISPEIFSRNFGGVSHKSDVYSYGMMVLEMAGARNIVETEAIRSCESYFSDRIYELVVVDMTTKLNDFLIEEDEERERKMFLVGFWCIQTSPSDRPSMSKVVEMLEGDLESIQIPPKPFQFCPVLSGPEISPSLSE